MVSAHMLPQARLRGQGYAGRRPSAFIESIFVPLSLVDIHQLVESSGITRTTDRLAYECLVLHADARGDTYGMVRDVAAYCNMELQTCYRVLKRLRAEGHISVSPHGGKGKRRANRWHLSAIRDQQPHHAA